jgi:hypothetical protein
MHINLLSLCEGNEGEDKTFNDLDGNSTLCLSDKSVKADISMCHFTKKPNNNFPQRDSISSLFMSLQIWRENFMLRTINVLQQTYAHRHVSIQYTLLHDISECYNQNFDYFLSSQKSWTFTHDTWVVENITSTLFLIWSVSERNKTFHCTTHQNVDTWYKQLLRSVNLETNVLSTSSFLLIPLHPT